MSRSCTHRAPDHADTDDPQRCAQAGVPAERGFATKPQLVVEMLDRALAAGVPFRYFAADAGYGRDPALRARCHAAARRQAATMSAP
jgi:SRSO17 transposase